MAEIGMNFRGGNTSSLQRFDDDNDDGVYYDDYDYYGIDNNFELPGTQVSPPPRQSKPKSQAPTAVERQAENRQETEALGYTWLPTTAAHEILASRLGIDESLLAPLVDERPPRSNGHSRSLKVLATHPPSQMRFKMSWPRDRELKHEWYEMLYTHLYVRVHRLVEKYFKLGDLPKVAHWDSLWAHEEFSEQFLYYAGLVARGDKKTGGWETLLQSELHRQYLVMGIIGKVLETTVFSDLLFGADPDQRQALEAQDKAMMQLEGYNRTYLRSDTVRALLCEDLLPPMFWNNVDELSFQLVKLLLPLVKLLDVYFPASRDISLRALHQDLHHVVSQAGYLSVAIRWSRSIFRFRTPLPGETNDDREQQHIDEAIYTPSREAADRQDRFLEWRWRREQKKAAEKAQRKLPPVMEVQSDGDEEQAHPRRAGLSSRGARATAEVMITRTPKVKAKAKNQEPIFFPPSRMAKVQIVLWPSLQRFSAGSPLGQSNIDPKTGTAEGTYETWLFKAAVVYYLGRLDPKYEAEESHPTLHEFIRRSHWRRLPHRGPTGRVLLNLALPSAVVALVFGLLYAAVQHHEGMREYWDQLKKVVLFGLLLVYLGLTRLSHALSDAIIKLRELVPDRARTAANPPGLMGQFSKAAGYVFRSSH